MSTGPCRELAALLLIALTVSVVAGCWPNVKADDPMVGEDVAGRAELRARIRKARKLKVRQICEPIRSVRGGQVEMVPNPDGKTYDVLVRYMNTYWGPHTTVIIDLGTGEIKRHVRPSALYSRTAMGPDGKYYSTITGEGGTAIQVYDPATNTITDLKDMAKRVRGETRPLVIGPDGMMYGAGSSASKAIIYQLNPTTGKITMYGHVGPSHAPADCWGYTVGADETYVYVASGKTPWYLVAYNRKTKKDAVLLTIDDPKGYIGVSQRRHGCAVSAQYFKDKKRTTDRYWVRDGKLTKMDKHHQAPPWKVTGKPWVVFPPKPELGAAGVIPKADGKCELWYRSPEDKKNAPKDPPAGAKPEDLGWKVVRYEIDTYPFEVPMITGMADGRAVGSGGNYVGNFIYDPKTNRSDHPGILKLSHYCTTVLDGKVYMSGYPGSALYEWDPDKPWTANATPAPWLKPVREDLPESNPRRLTYLTHDGSGCHKMLAAVSAAGKVFFGGRWYRNGEGGGLGWWDPKTKKAGGIDLPFRNYQVHYMASTGNGRYLVLSTQTARDLIGKTPKPESAKIIIFDTLEMKVVRDLVPVKGAELTGPVAGSGGTTVLGITYNPADRIDPDWKGKYPITYGQKDKTAILYKIDAATGKVLWTKTLPYPVGIRTNENAMGKDGFAFELGPDGKVWTYTGGKFIPCNPKKKWNYSYLGRDLALVRIDPKDGAIDIVGRLDWPGKIAFSGRDIILDGGCRYLVEKNTYLRRIRGVVR